MIQPKMASTNQADGSFNHANYAKPVIVQRKAQPSKKLEFFDSDDDTEQYNQPTYQAA
jgi:hypothetical protein